MSSDSDDDCYSNIAQRLQKMKNNYQDDKIQTTNLLDESTDLDDSLKQDKICSPKKKLKTADCQGDTGNSSTSDILDNSIETPEQNLRITRSSGIDLPAQNLPPSRRKNANADSNRGRGRGRSRGRGRGRGTPSPRGRGRGTPSPRGRRWRNRNTIVDFLMSLVNHDMDSGDYSNIPTYSVGNTEEYPDQSTSQALFSQKKPEVVVVEENDPLDDNEELSVKVYWMSVEFVKFNIRKFQKLTQIFDYFMEKHNVSRDNLYFTYNDVILKPDDTPDSIEYNIAKFIDGGIVHQSVSQLITKDGKLKDGITIKFQCQNVKKPVDILIRLDDKMSVAMMKCAEHLEMPLEKLKFVFDGDCISGKSTARELELEGGECIDVKILS